jgi:hypothetical protein
MLSPYVQSEGILLSDIRVVEILSSQLTHESSLYHSAHWAYDPIKHVKLAHALRIELLNFEKRHLHARFQELEQASDHG